MRNKLACLALLAVPFWAKSQDRRAVDSLYRAFHAEADLKKRADLLYEIAIEKLSASDSSELNRYADSIDLLSKRAGNGRGIARALDIRGQAFYQNAEYTKALPVFKQELSVATEARDSGALRKALANIGNSYNEMGMPDSSLAYLFRAAEIVERQGDRGELASIYANIGNMYGDNNAPDQAIEHLQKALKIRQELGQEKRMMFTYNNLMVAYGKKDDFPNAFDCAERGLAIATKFDNKLVAGVICASMSHLLDEQGRFAEAIQWGERSMAYLTAINRKSNMVYPLVNLARAHNALGHFQQGLELAERGHAIMASLGLTDPMLVYYEQLAAANEGLGRYREALAWQRRYVALSDSISERENLQKLANLDVRYQTRQKEADLAQKNLQLAAERTRRNLILVAALLAIAALVGWFQLVRNRQRIRQREARVAAQLEHTEAERLRELDRLKSAFFANISHEFRTPLTLILSPLDQILNGSLAGDLKKYHGIMRRNAQRLLELVNQLLDLSKLEAGKMSVQAAPGDLGQFVRSVAFSFESLAVRKNIRFSVDTPKGPVAAWFDRDKLEKVLTNLLSNAFKFTPDDGQVSAALSVDDNGRAAVITIKDSGIGIPAGQMPHLFERFFQTQNTSDLQAGSGIGLALTKELVELHHGQISAESTEGRGSVFTIRLPLGEEVFSENEKAAADLPLLASSPTTLATIVGEDANNGQKQSIFPKSRDGKDVALVVEDNPDVRLYIREQLEKSFHIVEAENGAAGLQKAQAEMPALVITDLMMPDMDGLALTRSLKTDLRTSHIPVIMLTAKAASEEKIEGFHTGADAYLTKPFDARELVAQAEGLIRARRGLREKFSQSGLMPSEIAVTSVDEEFLKKIRLSIEENLDDETFGVVELAAKVALSRSQLHRKLTAVTGHGPNEIIRNMRLERAKELLEKGAGNASEVAFMVGFNSLAYFSKSFSDHFGFPPSEVRKGIGD